MFELQCHTAHKELLAGTCPWCGRFIVDGRDEQSRLDIGALLARENIRALLVDKEAIPLLCPALRHADAATRRTAATLIGRIGPDAKEALPALRVLLLDEDQLVRDTAQAAINNIDR